MAGLEFDVAGWLQRNPSQACAAASISEPQRLGAGWTKTDVYSHGDASGLPSLRLPTPPVDLNDGLASFIPKDPAAHAGIEILVREAFAAAPAGVNPLERCDILSFRNNLNKIFGLAFDTREGWVVDACCWPAAASAGPGATLFLDIVKTEDNAAATAGNFVPWGYVFEAVCTGEAAANPNHEYGILLHWKLTPSENSGSTGQDRRLRVFMGAEIDAYDPQAAEAAGVPPDGMPPLKSLREIKTFPYLDASAHPGQWRTTYRHRHPKWWLQSYLAGVPALVLGARDRSGVVREIHTVQTADLPRISWRNGERWSPQQALAFGATVLTWMRSVAGGSDGAGRHWRFEYNPESQSIAAKVLEGGNLPDRLTAVLAECT